MKKILRSSEYDANIISILVPVFNEEQTVDAFFKRMDPVVEQITDELNYQVELIFTDNASVDDTYDKILSHSKSRPYVKIYRFSKNVGFQRSIISGYSFTKGAACIQIDCDLEDPPELIIAFIKKWQEGNMVVYGKRKHRNENWFMRAARTSFYKVVNFLSEADVPLHAGDFRLIDRRIIDIVCQVNDAEPYLRGLIANLGFRQVGIEYDRSARVAGTSSFNLRSYASLAAEGILQSSIKPLNISLYLSAFVLVFSIGLAAYYIYGKLAGQMPSESEGFVTLAVLGLFQFSFLLLVVGINSLYLGRVYRQVFKRPISITDRSNMENQEDISKLVYWPSEPSILTEDHKLLNHERNRD